jgi:hypothetical protein
MWGNIQQKYLQDKLSAIVLRTEYLIIQSDSFPDHRALGEICHDHVSKWQHKNPCNIGNDLPHGPG